MTREQHAQVVAGLLHDNERTTVLYESSAMFHAAVDQLAAWLPMWVEAMADAAEVARERMLAEQAAMEQTLPRVVVTPGMFTGTPFEVET